jgi:hypothetical protein
MKVERIAIKNFRSFGNFQWEPKGESRFIIGECGVGKTSLLAAVFRGLGKDRGAFTRADFRDPEEVIEIELVVTDLNADQQAVLCDRVDFAHGKLTVGIRATWDEADESAVAEHGYPTKGWAKSTAEERNALLVQWLPAERDIGKYLQFGMRWNPIARLIEQLGIEGAIKETGSGIQQLVDDLGAVEPLKLLLEACRKDVAKMLPDVTATMFKLSSSPGSDLAILRLLALAVAHHGEHVGVAQQSSGLGQVILFAFLMELARREPGTLLLIDQPELSLHPHPQRSLARQLESLPCQFLAATHSSNVLDRVDPRRIVCLRREADGVEARQPAGLNAGEARKFARYTTPQTAEAFFAKCVILVEGLSDLYSLVALAERQGRDLDGEGVSLVDMEGAGGLRTFLGLLGPQGFGLRVAGICDADKEMEWGNVLQEVRLAASAGRGAMKAAGFFVCDRDLEEELIRAFGMDEIEKLIDEEGELAAYKALCGQPNQKGKSREDRLHTFLRSRGRHVRYAPLIVERLDLAKVPKSLTSVLKHV